MVLKARMEFTSAYMSTVFMTIQEDGEIERLGKVDSWHTALWHIL